MPEFSSYINSLKHIFKSARDKYEANRKCVQIMADMSGDRDFFTAVLNKHLEKAGSLNTLHYPVVGLNIESNEHFELVANCWIPLPDNSTDISTKAIHHHGDMLLTTATAFGTGYEHWLFETPSIVDAGREIYELKVLEQAAHPLNHVAFVDAYIAHLPLYPPDLTITYALWSSRFPTTWKDSIKRIPVLKRNSQRLRDAAAKFGLAKQLELKVVEYFDFYPTCEGFRGIKNREEFPLTNNQDYLASLFHIIQETGNENLAPLIRRKLDGGEKIDNKSLIDKYLRDLETGVPISGKLSGAHYGVAKANFSKAEILTALSKQTENSYV